MSTLAVGGTAVAGVGTPTPVFSRCAPYAILGNGLETLQVWVIRGLSTNPGHPPSAWSVRTIVKRTPPDFTLLLRHNPFAFDDFTMRRQTIVRRNRVSGGGFWTQLHDSPWVSSDFFWDRLLRPACIVTRAPPRSLVTRRMKRYDHCRLIATKPSGAEVVMTRTALRSLMPTLASLVFASAAVGQGRIDALGDSLPDGAIARVGTTRMRHFSLPYKLCFGIGCIAWLPDGKSIATTSFAKEGRGGGGKMRGKKRREKGGGGGGGRERGRGGREGGEGRRCDEKRGHSCLLFPCFHWQQAT